MSVSGADNIYMTEFKAFRTMCRHEMDAFEKIRSDASTYCNLVALEQIDVPEKIRERKAFASPFFFCVFIKVRQSLDLFCSIGKRERILKISAFAYNDIKHVEKTTI